MSEPRTIILGGGVTGLAAGIACGARVYEAEERAGGICSSYYVLAGSRERLAQRDERERAWRFEHGGGHWIFGGHPDVLSIVERLAPCERAARRSSVYFPDTRSFVGFPLQHHLHQLPPAAAAASLAEMLDAPPSSPSTMAQWLDATFGPTLGELFFRPFHEAYTAGLQHEIAPQDGYKTPLDRAQVLRGAFGAPSPAGYNVTFLYPRDGLDALIRGLAARADVALGRRAVRIDTRERTVAFDNGERVRYDRLLSTLPLNRTLELAGLRTEAPAAPYTSVLVLNIGGRRGPRCPDDHWLYVPRSASGFHRVGFYSNVAAHFLPAADRAHAKAASLYVERSYRGGERPAAETIERYAASVVEELQHWGFIGEVDVVDPTWVDVAYTWSHPGSRWVAEASALLASHGIGLAGRYARWTFQGIADSLRDGFIAGQAMTIAG